MKKLFRLSTFCIASISIPLALISTSAFAQSSHSSYWKGYDYGYDDGYDDGYEDAMDDCPCPPGLFIRSGFYAGAGVGYEGFQANRNIDFDDNRIGTYNTHANGWNGRLLGGYGRFFHNYYLGGEVFVGTSGASGKDSSNLVLDYDGKFSAGTSYGISIMPGYKVGGSLVYGRLGYIDTQFKVKDTLSTAFYSSSTSWTSGLNIGLGVEIPIYNKVSARLEYEYIDYSSVNNPGTINSDTSPSDNRGSVSFLFRF